MTWDRYTDIQGTGKGVIAGALLHPFSRCIGIELLSGLYSLSLQQQQVYHTTMPLYQSSHPPLFPTIPDVSFINSSFFDVDWSDARVILANSTCFTEGMMDRIGNQTVKVGTFAITLTRKLPGKRWTVLESGRRKMSWGEATVFLHRRTA